MHEIEEKLESLAREGQKIKKISFVGYSLGGLLARYVIGLLETRGWFDQLEPMNFTTFATPHVGVRAPLKGWKDKIYNTIGGRTISRSGRQLFLIDSFRDTDQPLLSVLADPNSIFIKGLKKFPRRTCYANIVNDLSVKFYTSALSKVDPFVDLDNVNINYVKGYEDVIIDPDTHVLPPTSHRLTFTAQLWKKCKSLAIWVPLSLLLIILSPLAVAVIIIHTVIQICRSSRRIRMHENGESGVPFGKYRIPLLAKEIQHVVEQVFEGVNASQKPDYISSSEDQVSDSMPEKTSESIVPSSARNDAHVGLSEKPSNMTSVYLPKLALTPEQFEIIDSLKNLGIRTYPVHIHKSRRSHMRIIARSNEKKPGEGKWVMKHWLDNEFVL